ncbi:N,N-dimethyltransferase OxyT [Paraburkholderia aspalathi]|uniref:N,N-dimethyltransferase OxyT n=1 Tax=Paraburkholderia aspalathi TaxID=1324617 RepID=A0ABM8SWB5_9BURK|nr:methyltransferase [Paraburkholderia aspalathi]MBK3823044.1 methyltransferase [Paraburkholderia aspalathi]MBK3834853.1 methyltransferase [Paraburkholderia aspalathi]MBK3864617.1 methyltransferase [Paraburkholderia aspalathi]CAE6837821.1 N,N-dimethyltransferase OxyT [Paraburkholderia aspalathi]
MQSTPNAGRQESGANGASQPELTPERLLQLGMGFWASKTLLSAVELGVFTRLASGPHNAAELTEALGLHPRSVLDFLDALVALNLLERENGTYRNTPDSDLFLDMAKPSYVGGLLEMANARLYPFWGSLTEALRTGQPQNEAKQGGNLFDSIYHDEHTLRSFLRAMSGVSLGAAKAIAQKFPWQNYGTFIDIGTAQGALPVQVALAHPHLRGGGFDLPVVGPVFDEYVTSHGLQERLLFHPGDFFKDSCPSADVLVMGHILHDWDLEQKLVLLAKCYSALPPGGCLIVYDAVIDDDRRRNAFGLLMSLNMLIETSGGFDYTGAQCCTWMKEVGFTQIRVEPLAGPDSMVIGIR